MLELETKSLELLNAGTPFVMITVVNVRGSAPREVGARLLVTSDELNGTIGGGNLEHKAVLYARDFLLEPHKARPELKEFSLGASLGQCCGGHVSLFFEPRIQPVPVFAIFGAGHIGRALVKNLEPTPCRILWTDPRPEEFPKMPSQGNVNRTLEGPETVAEELDSAAIPLIVTHSHALDFELVRILLGRGFSWVGLIGSHTKARRFYKRLEQRGLGEVASNLFCPVGEKFEGLKHPAILSLELARTLWLRANQVSCDKMRAEPEGAQCFESA